MRGVWRWGVAVLTLGAALPVAAHAQDNPPLWRWVDSRGSFCIWYLADPTIAATLLPAGTTPRSVASSQGIPANLLRIVQDEPRFAAWTPGLICVGQFEVVAANGSPVARQRSEHPVRFTLTALGAEGEVEWQLLELGLDAGSLDQVAEDLGIPSKERRLRLRQGLAGEDDQWSLELDGATLGWIGHLSGRPDVGMTRTMSFGYARERGGSWRLTMAVSSDSTERQIGSLRIEGKGALAAALRSSPIRAVGAMERGGTMVMTFRRPPEAQP